MLGAIERRGKLGGKLCDALRKEDLGMGLDKGNECIRLAVEKNEQSDLSRQTKRKTLIVEEARTLQNEGVWNG